MSSSAQGLKVRAESPDGKSLRGSSVSIRNQEGVELARANLESSDNGAYEANSIVVAAPRMVGEHEYHAVVVAADNRGTLREQASTEVRVAVMPHAAQLTVRIAGWDSELPHAIGSFPVGVRVFNPPDCEVTVSAVDRGRQTPVKGARVVMHPYRAVTDENGIAKVKVTRGQYDILVSGSRYLPVRTSVEVTADLITRAELDVDRPWESPDEVSWRFSSTCVNTMPPDSPGTLTDQQALDAIAHMFAVSNMPAGDKELPLDLKALANIMIEAQPK